MCSPILSWPWIKHMEFCFKQRQHWAKLCPGLQPGFPLLLVRDGLYIHSCLSGVWWCLVVSSVFEPCDWSTLLWRRATSLSITYTFLLTSLRVHKVPIIVIISCLVPMESSWAVHHDSKYISYVTKQQNEYWRKNCQNSCLSDQLHKDDTERNYVPDSSPVSRACIIYVAFCFNSKLFWIGLK